MFKVSFKERTTPNKVVVKSGNVTSVTYRGTVELPKIWWYMPSEIREWMNATESVEVEESIAHNMLTIYSRGLARCHEDDKYDTILGERLAEARAKHKIYKFFYQLCNKLIDYYNHLVYGNESIACFGRDKGLMGDLYKYEKLCDREEEHIKALLNKEEDGNE